VGIFAVLASLVGVVIAFSLVEGSSAQETDKPWLRTVDMVHGYVNKRGNAIHESIQKAGNDKLCLASRLREISSDWTLVACCRCSAFHG
jgi:hypothetical protein